MFLPNPTLPPVNSRTTRILLTSYHPITIDMDTIPTCNLVWFQKIPSNYFYWILQLTIKIYFAAEISAAQFSKKYHTYFTTLSAPYYSMTMVSILYFYSSYSIDFISLPKFNSPYFINISILCTLTSRCAWVQCWHLRISKAPMIPLIVVTILVVFSLPLHS